MLPIPATALDPAAASALAAYQDEIDTLPDYAARVAAAQILYKRYSRNATFRVVRNTLTSLCSGPRRCMYCEDSCANAVEHHHPKDLYPERAFVWTNLLYACERCNSSKGDRFEVFSFQTGQRISVSRASSTPITPPEPGHPLLLDPRRENPMDFLSLDIIGTFHFFPARHLDALSNQRADYTIEILKLNDPPLPESRRNAHEHCISHLHRYLNLRGKHGKHQERRRVIRTIQRMEHRTVWEELKRRHTRIPRLNELFSQAPEALDW
jgi:uncharacterized protein (TIGR02646 family)